MPFTVLRIQKLKTWGAIAGLGKHNQRERDTPNADESRTPENQLLLGTPEKGSVDAIKEAIGSQLIRKNAVLGVEMLLSASPQYFRPDAPEQAGRYEPDRLESWKQATTGWLQERYGERVIKATLHLDEATPHMHVLLVPLDDKGKLNCRALFGGSKHTLSNLQTDYAQAVAGIGIERGIENSRATHQKVSQFYTLTQAENATGLPLAQSFTAPEMPNKITRMSDERLTQYASQAATSGAKAQRETLEPFVNAVRNENKLLKRENMNLKKANSRLTKEKSEMQRHVDQVRGLNIGLVLNKLFKAKGPYASNEEGWRRYILPSKQEVLVNDTRWNIATGKRGKGAIDLVMALRGFEQQDLPKAVGELAHSFGVEKATGEYTAKTLETAAAVVRSAVKAFTPEQEHNKLLSVKR